LQIEQILVNLVVNARDAMPDGGTVTVRASTASLGAEDCDSSEDASPGNYCVLEVIDTGVGMDEGTIDRIFEPFFTTKGRAEGSGLGLATTYGIVKQNRGFIEVRSHLGCGSTFRVFVPMREQAAIAEEHADVRDIPRGTECILLVEDEDTVRELASTVLRQWGYNVLEARHAEEAVHIWKRERDAIDLLLTDVIMPGSDGRKLFRQLRAERPDIHVLFMSGYDEKMMNRRSGLGDMPHFIPKPFTAQKLTTKVREVLDA
jgi:two-component system cell cycle sensor histidine kinase/response regulator CckA